MQKLLSTTALAAVMAVGVIGGAAAVPLNTAFSVQVWNFNNPSPGNGGSSAEQALPNAQPGGSPTTTFTYTGALNFGSPPGGNTIASFIASGGGTSTGSGPVYNSALSQGGFTLTSLFKFTFTTAVGISGTITHDDGVSLFVSGVTNVGSDLLPVSASAPTAPSSTAYSIGPGTYDLYYTEANGLPAQLNFNVASTTVPEPATLALLGTGLIGAGFAARRRRSAPPSA